MPSKIEWTDETWNPIVGCSKVSPGCQNCYAEGMAYRQTNMRPGCEYCSVIDGKKWNGATAFVESAFDKPLHWRKPRKIFVCSMGDLFHESVPFEWIDKVFAVMALCPQHTFQVLTKRPERMAVYFNNKIDYGTRGALIGMKLRGCNTPWLTKAHYEKKAEIGCAMQFHGGNWPLPNVWLGTSCENQEQADKRIPHLLQCPAAVRFVSCEPLLGEVNLNRANWMGSKPGDKIIQADGIRGCTWLDDDIHWVICGGESGPKARPMHPDWVRSLRDQCEESGVPFMFKQWGEWAPAEIYSPSPSSASFYRYVSDGKTVAFRTEPNRHSFDSNDPYSGNVCAWRVGKAKAGSKLDGVEHLEFPNP